MIKIIRLKINRYIDSKSTLLVLTSVGLWFFFPILSILPILFGGFSGYVTINLKGQKFILLLISLSFGLLAFTAESVSLKTTDMFRYQELYASYVGKDISDILIKNLFFDVINYFLANYISNNPQFVGLFWVTIAYYFMLLSVVKIVKSCFAQLSGWIFLILLSTLVIMPFVWISELLKQSVTFSIFSYALSIKLSGEKGAIWYLIIAFLLHMSVIIILPIYFFNNVFVRKFIVPIFISCIFLSFFNILDVLAPIAELPVIRKLGLSERIKVYAGGYGFLISRRFIFNFIFFLLQTAFLVIVNIKNLRGNKYLVLCILAAGILFMNMGNPHNFVRLTYIYYPFYIFTLLFFLSSSNISTNKFVVYFLVILFYLLSNFILTNKFVHSELYSNQYMDNNLLKILVSNVFGFLNYSVGVPNNML